MKTPIAVVVFNRPEQTRRLYDRLEAAGPRELFLISDGARAHVPQEQDKVDLCRSIFLKWPGIVHTNFSERNLGCKARISSGLTWVFEQTDRSIVLEDDCLPHPQFFKFCDELLQVYAKSFRIMSICGSKLYPGTVEGDYFFSRYNNCWGWATWKHAWAMYDESFNSYSHRELLSRLRQFLGSTRAAIYWHYLLRSVRAGKLNSWAYCWMVSCFLNQGLHVYPRANLVVNTGQGPDATHTQHSSPYMPRHYGDAMAFPLSPPRVMEAAAEVDRWIEDHMYSKSIANRYRWVLRKAKQHCLAPHRLYLRARSPVFRMHTK